MLGINCLVNNWQLKDELKDLVGLHVDILKTQDKAPTVLNVYNSLKREGFEIDAQTVGVLYADTAAFKEGFSTQDEIDAFTDQTYIDLFTAEAEVEKNKTIGKDSPVVATVAALMNGVKLMAEQNPTLQRIFQDRLLKAAKRVTGFKGESIPKNASAEQILREAFSIEQNNPFGPGFSAMENAELLWREFKKEFAEVADVLEQKGDVYNADKIRNYADILENATYQLMLSSAEVQKIISDTLKEAGFIKTITTGTTTREIVDWNAVFNQTDFNFRETIKDVFRSKGFNEKELSRIADEMEGEYQKLKNAKLQASLRNANKGTNRGGANQSAIHRLQRLYQYGIFTSSNMDALFRVLKVEPTTMHDINVLHKIMEINNRALATDVTEFTPSYLKTLEREIEIIIEHSEESRNRVLKAIRAFSFYNQISNAFLLSNPQNITENTLSNIFQLFTTIAFTQPLEAIRTLKVVATVGLNYAKGGVQEGNQLTNSFNNTTGAENRFNFQTAKTPQQKIIAGTALYTRLVLGVADNAVKAGIVHQAGIDTLKRELKRQGLTKREANIVLNETFYGNKDQNEIIAKGLVQNLQDSGIKVPNDTWKRFASELAWANLSSNGDFFQDTLEKLESAGLISKTTRTDESTGAEVPISFSDQLIKDIRVAVEAAAGKGIGHQSDSLLLKFVDQFSSYFSRNVAEARNRGHGLSGAELERSVFAQATRFQFGSYRWMWLSLEKATGLALIQTLITDILLAKRRGRQSGFWNTYSKIDIDIDENDLNAVKRRAKEIEWYASLKQRLIRETIGPILGYMVLRSGVAIFNALSGGGGDDDYDKKRALIAFAVAMREDSLLNRWYQKVLSPRAYNYLSQLAWKDRYGKIQKIKMRDMVLPEHISPAEIILGFNEIAPSVINNLNASGVGKFIDAFKKWNTNRDKAKAELAENAVGIFFTSPFKVYDVQTGAFKHNPMLRGAEYKKYTAEGWWEGLLKGFVDKNTWKNIQDNEGTWK